MITRITAVTALLLLMLCTSALAQQAELEVDAAELEAEVAEAEAATCACPEEEEVIEEAAEPELKRWEGNIEVGYVKTTGNTKESSGKGAFDITYRNDNWRNVARGDYFSSESDGSDTARRFLINNRTGFVFTERDYIWLSLTYEDDDFNGFEYTASGAIGYGRQLIKRDTMDWIFEIGPGYRFTETEDTKDEFGVIIAEGEEEDEAILRINTEYQWRITDTSKFEQLLSTEIGSDNTVSRSLSSLILNVVGRLNVKLSYEMNYTKEVPDDKDETDTITSVTLLYGF
jgi:putative salt-induced outer membrane protein